MSRFYHLTVVFSILLLLVATPLYAQERPERKGLIENLLGPILDLVREAATLDEDGPSGDRLREIVDEIRSTTLREGDTVLQLEGLEEVPDRDRLSEEDLARLEASLRDLNEQVAALRAEREQEAESVSSPDLEEVEAQLEEALALTRRLRYESAADEAYYGPSEEIVDAPDSDLWAENEEKDDDHPSRRRWRSSSFDRRYDAGVFVGDFPYRWPFAETALYRTIPAVRYNRVEGFVLGVGSRPLEWDDFERSRIVGQVGYAFSLNEWRYEAGLETRVGSRYSDFATKLGGAYRRNTATNDLWKSNWIENSLAAFFFENDFFDYYQVEGWTFYGVQRLTPYAQLSAGYRSEEYSSLERNTRWSVFGGNGFRFNPPVDEARINAFVIALEGGRVYGYRTIPRGTAFRAEVELAGLGGDFTYTRYLADARFYIPTTRHSSYGFRLRGGLVNGDVPLQKEFVLGGIGSVRGYPQNAFAGTKMLLANVEYVVDNLSLFDDLFEDLQVFGFADAGWAGTDESSFDFDDVLPSAGFGVGLDDRNVRLELAFPLKDVGTGMSPSLWLRLSPSF